MARIPYPPITDSLAESASILAQRRGGQLPNLYRMLLHSPPVAHGWLALGTAIRYETQVPADLREMAICCVAAMTDSHYEWRHHAPLAREAGVTDAELDALRSDGPVSDAPALEGRRRAAVKYVAAVVADRVDEDHVGDAARSFSPTEVIELSALASYYLAVSRFLAALDVDVDEWAGQMTQQGDA